VSVKKNGKLVRDAELSNAAPTLCEQKLNAIGIADDELTQAIAAYPIWLCDDDTRETMDFVGIDEGQRKIVFVHAKMGKQEGDGSGFNVTSLQDVRRQALASLAFISRGEPSPVWTKNRRESEVQANKKTERPEQDIPQRLWSRCGQAEREAYPGVPQSVVRQGDVDCGCGNDKPGRLESGA
jgi:hypothetical protein